MSTEYQFGEEFQSKLLALYLREPQSAYGIVEPVYFTSPIYSDIARLAKELYAKHDRKELRLSKSTLYAIVKAYLGKRRRDLWKPYRRTIKTCYSLDLNDRVVILEQALIFAKEQKFRGCLIEAEKDINNHRFDKAISRFVLLKNFGVDRDLGINYWEGLDNPNRWKEDREGLVGTFYLKTLDKAMGGGLGSGELAIILAGGKVGKTTMLARLAAGALWQGKNVAIATGELSAKKYRKRIDAMITRVPGWKLTRAAVNLDRSYDEGENEKGSKKGSRYARRKLKKLYRKLALAQRQMKGSLWIKQWPTNKGKISDIEAWLDQLEEQGTKVDILFVDYVRVFRPNENSDEQRMRIGQVAMDLRGVAIERGIPVWTASQTNRAALHKARIGPEDIAEDISQFWTLDFLIVLCQTEEEKNHSLDAKTGEVIRPEHARLFLTAARDVGQSRMINISIERSTFVVKEQNKQPKGKRR